MNIAIANAARSGLALVCLAVSGYSLAAGQTSTNFTMQRDSVNAGVGDMNTINYSLSASVGDAVAGGTIASVSFQLSSGFRAAVTASPAVLNLLSVVSRKLHGPTAFSIVIDHGQPLNGNVTVEPRSGGAGHTLVFHFDGAVTSVNAAATALDGMMNSVGAATAAAVGGDAVVTLGNVADGKRLTVTLTGINGAGTAQASMGFLLGDVNNTRSVNASDAGAVKARSGQVVTTLNFQFDVNTSGTVNAADIAAVKARSGQSLP